METSSVKGSVLQRFLSGMNQLTLVNSVQISDQTAQIAKLKH